MAHDPNNTRCPLNDPETFFQAVLGMLTEEQREEVMGKVAERYCDYCWRELHSETGDATAGMMSDELNQ